MLDLLLIPLAIILIVPLVIHESTGIKPTTLFGSYLVGSKLLKTKKPGSKTKKRRSNKTYKTKKTSGTTNTKAFYDYEDR